MTPATRQRVAVSALIADIERLVLPRVIGAIANVLERDIKDVMAAFDTLPPRLVVVGDHDAELDRALDAVREAVKEGGNV